MLYRDIFGWEGEGDGGGDKGDISQVLTKKVKDLRFSRSEGFIYAYVHCTSSMYIRGRRGIEINK